MACKITPAQIKNLYADIYRELKVGMDNLSVPTFDINSYMKDLYTDIVDESDPDSVQKTRLLIQAVPEIYLKVTARPDVVEYILKKDKLQKEHWKIAKMVKDFEDLNVISKFLSEAKISKAYINAAIKVSNATRGRMEVINDVDMILNEVLMWSEATGRMKPLSAWTLTGQEFVPINPEGATEAERNAIIDESQVLTYKIIREIVANTRNITSEDTQVTYRGVPVSIRAMRSSDIDIQYFDDSTQNKYKENRIINGVPFRKLHSEGVSAVISDTDGNLLYFDENGDITDEESGRLVLQGLRKTSIKTVGKTKVLALSNNASYSTILVSPKEIADRQQREYTAMGQPMTDAHYEYIIKRETDRIKKEVNDLHLLREKVLSGDDQSVLLPITGGTFGIVGSKFVPLYTTNIESSDIKEIKTENIKGEGGYAYFTLKSDPESQRIYMQRANMTDDMIDHLVDILVTDAKFKGGKPLTAKQRVDYAKVFLGPTPVLKDYKTTPIVIKTYEVDGVEELMVVVNSIPLDMEDVDDVEFLREKLKTQIVGKEQTFSAPLNYNSDYVNITFTDYVIEGDKVVSKQVDYFNFIKPYIQVLYTEASAPYLPARNAYLSYAIPVDAVVDVELDIEEEVEEAPAKKKTKKEEDEKTGTQNAGAITFKQHTKEGYVSVKQAVVQMADIVLEFNPTFSSNSSKVTQNAVENQNKAYHGQPFARRNGKLVLTPAAINSIVNQINAAPGGVVTITGNDITELKGYSQAVLNNFMYNTLKAIIESDNLKIDISNVITTGQTGIEEAATLAAAKLGLQVNVVAPKGWWTATYKKTTNTRFRKQDKRSAETKFKARFKVNKPTAATAAPKKTPAQQKVIDTEVFDNTPEEDDEYDLGSFNRSMSVGSFFDKYFTTAKQKKKAQEWWDNSPLSKAKDANGNLLIPVTVITEIVNSDAFATWSRAGITLYEADGGTSVDLYHEAWHAFSQLYLSVDEKTALYNAMRQSPKWADADFIDIEEAIAEDFREFMLGNNKPKGIIGRIFDRIARALRLLFSKLTRRDLTRPRDIAEVKKYFDALYTGNVNHLTPSTENVMPEFNVLNRSKTINILKQQTKNYSPFTIDDSKRITDAIDSVFADIFLAYNRYNKTVKDVDLSSGMARVLNDSTNREKAYAAAKKQFIKKRDVAQAELKELVAENKKSDNPDLDTEAVLRDNLLLFSKVVDNFGDVTKSLTGEEKKGVIAHHIQTTRFNVLKDTYVELSEDPGEETEEKQEKEEETNAVGQIIPSTDGNTKSSKELASEETLMLISSIFKLEKKGDEWVRVKDKLGFDILESKDVVWNRLARTLAGSLTPTEMHLQLTRFAENYPEFRQIMELLPNPVTTKRYIDIDEFNTETKFWQDFKKPRIPYVQLNITKRTTPSLEVEGKNVVEFSSSIVNASFDVYAIFKVWANNFLMADPATSPFITSDNLTNILDIKKVVNTFSGQTKNGGKTGKLDPKRGFDFLDALGITLDRNSAEINAMMSNPKFAQVYGVEYIYSLLKMINGALNSDNEEKVEAARDFVRNPIKRLMDGLPKALRTNEKNTEDVRARLRALAEVNIKFSDSYANFSVLSPEKNRVWEHFLDSTLTRTIGALNKAKNLKYLIDEDEKEFDVDGEFRHMRWLKDSNNPHIKYSVNMNSMFYMTKTDKEDTKFGERKNLGTDTDEFNQIIIRNVAGTQILEEGSVEPDDGVSTSSADATTKYLQEMNTMLLRGIQEFMRHASKSMAQGIRAEKIDTALFGNQGKATDFLYVDIADFRPARLGEGEMLGFEILKGYIAGELERIQRFKANLKDTTITDPALQMKNWAGYNKKVRKKDGTVVMAGEVFTAFDDVLTEDVKEELYKINGNLMDALEEDDDLYQRVKADVDSYFEKQTKINAERLAEARYVDPALTEIAAQEGLTRKQVDEVLVKTYTYNSWIHNYETVILTYGDLAQYNHEKEEFHKRNAGMTAPGRGFRADQRAREFINSALFPRLYALKEGYNIRNYDGRIHTAIIKEKKVDSIMYEEYKETLYQDILTRLKNNNTIKNKQAYAKELADTEAKEYLGMKEGDGQGHVTLESYRMLKSLEGNWPPEQEALYKRIVNGEQISVQDVIKYFPPYKLQYFGNIDTKGLSVTSFHKFSLAPLIPSVTGSSVLNALHDKMMKDNIDYVVFETGSKLSHIAPDGKGDNVFNEDGTINMESSFTVNKVFAEFLKNQTEINNEYKEKSIFSTQLRKLILEGLYERGIIDTTDDTKITNEKVNRYIDNVAEYTGVLKLELLEQIGYDEKIVDGKSVYTPRNKQSTKKLVELIRSELERDDKLGDHLIEGFVDVTADGSLRYDLSLHPEAPKIEKLLLSIVNKRIIKQKVKGEPLVQVSAAMYEGVFGNPIEGLKKATDAEKKKYVGSNFLPTYHRKADGKTAAMKVMIALQGNFEYLLNLKHNDGEEIGTIDRLNEMIKDDKWLDKGTHRKSITMAGVRIPVQGLNSMEFMEVYHFLPPEAGNIIVPPSEIVAKSGADFDIDKLTTFMPNIGEDGVYKGRVLKKGKTKEQSLQILKDAIETAKTNKESVKDVIKGQKAALENELIEDIRNILELPMNYPSLIRPNGTYILKPIADQLAQYVMKYDPYQNMSSDVPNYKQVDDNGVKTVQKIISPTRVLEVGYNIYKHESNEIGKKTLGLGAVENTFNVIMNSLGAKMPATYLHKKDNKPRNMDLFLRHHTIMNENGEEVISLSNKYDVDSVYKIADLFSQAINGWVDVEKDAWIFFIQGNYELASTLLYLLKTGVPVREAIYFVSQPLVREYVTEQRQGKSTFAEPLGKKPKYSSRVRTEAADRVIKKHFGKEISDKNYYSQRRELSEVFFKDRENKSFTEKEMLDLIKNPNKNELQDMSKLMFLHFLEIEQQISGLTELKLNSNPDTRTQSTGAEVELSEAAREDLAENSKIDQNLRRGLREDAVISPMYNNELMLALIRPLMELRYHPNISKYIITHLSDFKNDVESTFGANKVTQMIDGFRNDLIGMLLQNSLRKFNISPAYKGYNTVTKIPVKLVKALTFGAYVQKNEQGEDTLYIDEIQLKQDFKYGQWKKDSEYVDSYEDRGLYALDGPYFTTNAETNEASFFAFVAEREYLRSITPLTKELTQTAEFKKDLEDVQMTETDKTYAEQVRYAYEKMLAMKALDNTYNPYKLFQDPEGAYAIKFKQLMDKDAQPIEEGGYGGKLKKEYPVLQRLLLDTNAKQTFFNLYINEKDYTNSLSNLYKKNLADLGDINVVKIANPEENMIISDFFARLPLVSLLQTGLNKTKLNFNNVVPLDDYTSIMQEQSQEFMKILNDEEKAENLLKKFYDTFVAANMSRNSFEGGGANSNKTRFKELFFTNDLEAATAKKIEKEMAPKYYVSPTATENLMVYREGNKTSAVYEAMVKYNPDVVFVANMPRKMMLNRELSTEGQELLAKYGMGIPFPTSNDFIDDNFTGINPKGFDTIKSMFEDAIKKIQDEMSKDKIVAFPVSGFGDARVMPKELFVYLSKRLFEEFGYVNPGSTMYKEVVELITEVQGISDAQIELKFNEENNPFKCKI